MRTFLVLPLLVLVAACDSGTSDGDLDVGSFTGFDVLADARIGGSAFHKMTAAGLQNASRMTVEFTVGPSDGHVQDYQQRTLRFDLPYDGGLRTGSYAEVYVESTRFVDNEVDGRESTGTATVDVSAVRPSGAYSQIEGTVSFPFPSGEVTGTFRAIDAAQPTPTRDCTARDCVTY